MLTLLVATLIRAALHHPAALGLGLPPSVAAGWRLGERLFPTPPRRQLSDEEARSRAWALMQWRARWWL
jgi:hypothetical protein